MSSRIGRGFQMVAVATLATLAGCSESDRVARPSTELREEFYAGGRNGTVFNATSQAFRQPAPAVADLAAFNRGEQIFETGFVTGDSGPFSGLGPVYIRRACIACHPGYGRARRVETFNPEEYGNGYLVFVHHPDGTIVPGLTAMLQTSAVPPFVPPVGGVDLQWNTYVDEHGNRYADGTPYSAGEPYAGTLIHPTATLVDGIMPLPADYRVSLEATIGIYGTGLIDAIPDAAIVAGYQDQQSRPGPVKGELGPWITEPHDGREHLGKFTFACSRATLENGPGSNALWNITNVTRADRRSNYLHPDWVTKMATMGIDTTGLLSVQPVELSQADFDAFMVWHRGLAVPAARNLDDPHVQAGQELFGQLGCAQCHTPSWITGPYPELPGYADQTIWPYTDLLKHDLGAVNHGRFPRFRTTPLWGRGLMELCADHSDMWHDLRARNFEEAILWHFGEAAAQREAFRNLSSAERADLIAFLKAI